MSPGRQGRPATSFRQRVPHDATNSSKRRFGQGRQAAICAISRHLRRCLAEYVVPCATRRAGLSCGRGQKLARRCRSDRGRWVVCRERASPNTVRLAGRATPTRGELVGPVEHADPRYERTPQPGAGRSSRNSSSLAPKSADRSDAGDPLVVEDEAGVGTGNLRAVRKGAEDQATQFVRVGHGDVHQEIVKAR